VLLYVARCAAQQKRSARRGAGRGVPAGL